MSDELKPGETRIYNNEGMPIGYGGGGGGMNHNEKEFYESIKRLYKENQKNKQQIIALNQSVDMVEDCYLNEIKILKQQREEMKNEIIQLREALKPFAVFAESWDKSPLRGMDDTIYSIHGGESCGGAELKLSDLKNARDAYNNTK